MNESKPIQPSRLHAHNYVKKTLTFLSASLLLATGAFVLAPSAQPAEALQLQVPEIAAAVVPETGPITIPTCPGTTSSSGGDMNTPSPLTVPENSKAANTIRDGNTLFMYGNQGATYYQGENDPDPGGPSSYNPEGFGGLPYCGARMLADQTLEVDWRFCTDQTLHGCADNAPSLEWSGTPQNPLDDEQKLQIANILLTLDTATKRSRAMAQTQIWCVSEETAAGTVNADVRQYFNSNDFRGDLDSPDPEYRGLSDDELRCEYLPDLTHDPELTITAVATTVNAGAPAIFELETNVLTPITVSALHADSVQLCPTTQPGVSFSGTTVTLSEPGTVTLCAYNQSSAEITLTADTGELASIGELGLMWNGNSGCQVFADYVNGESVQLTESASVTVIGNSTFSVTKRFTPSDLSSQDLDDVVVEVGYSTEEGSGTLWLTQSNDFTATGPSLPTGTEVTLTENSISGLPAGLEQTGAVWNVNGAPTNAPVTITVSDIAEPVSVELVNTIEQLLGTFEVRKSFALPEGVTQPAGLEVVVNWSAANGLGEGSLTLNDANQFTAIPMDGTDPILFPVGTVITLTEVSAPVIPGATLTPDWGSNAIPGDPSRAQVTISEAWDPAENTGTSTTAAEISLTNGIDLEQGSLRVEKDVTGYELGEGILDDVEIEVTANWVTLGGVTGSNVILLTADNNWSSGLGVDLPQGTEVTFAETGIHSSHPSISWNQTPTWSCAACNPPVDQQTSTTVTVTVDATEADPTLTITNSLTILNGGFSVEKLVVGDIDLNHPKLEGVEFEIEWTSSDPEQPSGSLVLAADTWSAQPTGDNDEALQFPLGTVVTLSELTPPNIPGLIWGDDIEWNLGDDELEAEITISGADETAEITVTNFAELHEGTFSIAKFVESDADVDLTNLEFSVNYREDSDEPSYEGTLTVQNAEVAISEAFPAGTELVLEEITPVTLPGTNGWQTPQFVTSDGTVLTAPVTIVIGDGVDVAVELVNVTEPIPVEPNEPGLPGTGLASIPLSTYAAIAMLVAAGVALTVISRRTRKL